MLIDRISHIQSGDQNDDLLFLINKFTPLLKHYAYKLHTEDAFSELTLAFIELIYNINPQTLRSTQDGAIVRYLTASIKNSYIALLRSIMKQKEATLVSWDGLTEHEQNASMLPDDGVFPPYNGFYDLLTACATLTEKERNVLILIYQHGLSSAEIARQMKTSKQNINQIKLRALNKLRSCIT